MAARSFSCRVRIKNNFLQYGHSAAKVAALPLSRKRLIQTSACLWDVTKVNMPALSPTMQEGTIIQWHKKEGDTIVPGDVLCDIQTDKSTLGLEVEEEGILAKIMVPDNTAGVKVGRLIALLVEEGEDWKAVEVSQTEVGAPSTTTTTTSEPTTTGQTPSSHDRHGFGPAVRTLLDQYSINMADVQGSGHGGRLLKGDLLKYIKEKNLTTKSPQEVALPKTMPVAPSPKTYVTTPTPSEGISPKPIDQSPPRKAVGSSDFTDLQLTNMRSIIAKRLTQAKTTIPHSYASIDCNIDKLLALRKELIGEGIKVSVNDFIIKASGAALQKVPEVNAVWSGEGSRLVDSVDICVAVATEAGLITPIVKSVNQLGLETISACVQDLAGRARQNKLQPEEFQGGSFTISNLGMFGIREFSAVVNPPQACILAIGSTRLTLDPESPSGACNMMSVTLSSDARIVDDFLASRFLEEFRGFMESPLSLLTAAPSPMTSSQTLLPTFSAQKQINKDSLFAE